jgi:hypothetical protein
MTVPVERSQTMRQQDKLGVSGRVEIAWALREWYTALAETEQSAQAEIYAYAADVVAAFLNDRHTIDALLDAYAAPSVELRYLVYELCTAGEAPLQPRLLMGAACALRLRELMKEAIT